jgi:hypothetical protein
MKNILIRFSASIGLSLLLTHQSHAQVNPYGRSPTINVPSITGFGDSSFKFSPQTGFDCPTPSLSIGGFGSGGNDWSNDYGDQYNSTGSGINNFGIGAGLRIPFGGASTSNCKEYSKILLDMKRIEMNSAIRNDQLTLLKQCHWLLVNEISRDNLKLEGPFSSLNACGYIKWAKPRPVVNGKQVNMFDSPPLSPVPVPTPVIIQQNVR